MGWLYPVLGFVVVQRLAELVLARANTRRLLAQGGIEHGAGHYPLFVALHAAWLIALAIAVPPERQPSFVLLGVYLVLQAGRLWAILSLGRFWTTRIVTVPGAPLVARGPYRFVRHPNYLIVVAEIAVLPLAFGAWAVATVFSVLNLALLAWRIRIEDASLHDRRVRQA